MGEGLRQRGSSWSVSAMRPYLLAVAFENQDLVEDMSTYCCYRMALLSEEEQSMRTSPCCKGSLGWRAHATSNAFADGVKTCRWSYAVTSI